MQCARLESGGGTLCVVGRAGSSASAISKLPNRDFHDGLIVPVTIYRKNQTHAGGWYM
jgi:hypothetical protein